MENPSIANEVQQKIRRKGDIASVGKI